MQSPSPGLVVQAVAVVHGVLRALVQDALAVLPLDLLVLGLADVEDVVVTGAAVDPAASEPDADGVVSGPAVDDVPAVAGVLFGSVSDEQEVTSIMNWLASKLT